MSEQKEKKKAKNDEIEKDTQENTPIDGDAEENSAQEAMKGMQTLFERVLSLSEEVEVAKTIAAKEKSRADDMKNLSDRLQADFDNYRKRTNENVKKIKEDAAAEVIEKFLPCLDSLNHGIASIKDAKTLEGVKLILRQFKDILASLNVEEIAALNEPFDPNLHNAVMQVPAKVKEEEHTVAEVFTPGYKIGDKVIRHSVVKVRT